MDVSQNNKSDGLNLSSIVIEGLRNLGTVINIDLSRKIISNAVKLLLLGDSRVPFNPEIYAAKPDCAKQSEYAIVTLLFLIIRNGVDKNKSKAILESYGINNLIIDDILKVCETNYTKLVARNLKTGKTLMHYSGECDWKLLCDVKHSQDSLNKFDYQITLYESNENNRKEITQFVCNAEELQALINKLKKIENHCTKVYKTNIGEETVEG